MAEVLIKSMATSAPLELPVHVGEAQFENFLSISEARILPPAEF
jgi:hypothetical protein